MIERNHEVLVPENAPAPEQLFRLAAIGVKTAANRQRLRSMQRTPKAHFFIDEVYFLNESNANEDPSEIRHRMAGRIGRKAINSVALREWSLKFFDTFWVQQPNGHWSAGRTRYRFEWDRARTTLSERSITILESTGATHSSTIAELLESGLQLEETELWNVRSDIAAVTAEDCDQLIADASEYYKRLIYLDRRAA